MYLPPHFREKELQAQHALIEARPLGLLISTDSSRPVVNPVPFLLDRATSPRGTLRCHLARANAQWQGLDQKPVLVVFQDADSYFTPSWYATKRETGRVVPTWNYAMVQARGTARVIEDRDWLARLVHDLTERHETGRREPWAVSDAPPQFVAGQLKGIVGVEIAIERIDGKWKMSQNRSAEDRHGVAAGLDAEESPTAALVADMVRRGGAV